MVGFVLIIDTGQRFIAEARNGSWQLYFDQKPRGLIDCDANWSALRVSDKLVSSNPTLPTFYTFPEQKIYSSLFFVGPETFLYFTTSDYRKKNI